MSLLCLRNDNDGILELLEGVVVCYSNVDSIDCGLGTKRFCSSLDLGNYCNYIKQPGDELEYRSCVFTCSTDGCNAATHYIPLSLLGALLLPALVCFLHLLYAMHRLSCDVQAFHTGATITSPWQQGHIDDGFTEQ
uniref:Protein sleepless n=1 Tax=Timema tahoe TaxID=61484 RepID=A0A7R9IND6_9NEOP|nr:unnamed protein product [Timema tahoe]